MEVGSHSRRDHRSSYLWAKNPKLAKKFTPEEIEMFKSGETPERFTWHHHQDVGRMQLVDYTIHRKTGHTGGYKIWGKDQFKD